MSNKSSFLRQLLSSPQYQALIQLAEDLIHDKQNPQTTRKKATQFETTFALGEEEGYVNGIRELLARAEKESQDGN